MLIDLKRLKALMLKLQDNIDKNTEKLRNKHDDYWDGYNDAEIEILDQLKKVIGIK